MDSSTPYLEGFKKLRATILASRGTHYTQLEEFSHLTPDDHETFQMWPISNLCPAFPTPWAIFLSSPHADLLSPFIIDLLTLTMSLSHPPAIHLPIAHDNQYLYRLTFSPYDLTSTGDSVPYCPRLKPTTPSPYFDYHILGLVNPYINPVRNRHDRRTNPQFCAPSLAGCKFAFFQLGPLSYAPHNNYQSHPNDFIFSEPNEEINPLHWKPTGFNLVLRLEFNSAGTSAHSAGVYAIYNDSSSRRPPQEICECGKGMLENHSSTKLPLTAANLRALSEEDKPFWAAPKPNTHDRNQFHVARIADELSSHPSYQTRIRWDEKIWWPVELVQVPKPGQNPVVAEEDLPTILGEAKQPQWSRADQVTFPFLMVLAICLASWIKNGMAW